MSPAGMPSMGDTRSVKKINPDEAVENKEEKEVENRIRITVSGKYQAEGMIRN